MMPIDIKTNQNPWMKVMLLLHFSRIKLGGLLDLYVEMEEPCI